MSTRFTRQEVNRTLPTGALALAAAGVLPPPPVAPVPLFDFAIAGGWYHDLAAALPTLTPGTRLLLRSEPDNPHDANAIAVSNRAGLMLGYIPREANAPIARLLRLGADIEATVIGPLMVGRDSDIPDDLAFTDFTNGDPRVRLMRLG